jgi:S-adenosylhomocysteine hydrolase
MQNIIFKMNHRKNFEKLMEQTKEVKIRDINDILESVSRIERQVELIKQGKTEVGETGVNRLDVIKEKAMLIRIIGKRM